MAREHLQNKANSRLSLPSSPKSYEFESDSHQLDSHFYLELNKKRPFGLF